MSKLRIALSKVNAWQVRIISLSLIVIFIGSSSQVLANALAAGAEPETFTPKTTLVIHKIPTFVSNHPIHSKLRRAGVDSLGGYTYPGHK